MPEHLESEFTMPSSLQAQIKQAFWLGELNVKTRALGFIIYDYIKRFLDIIFSVMLLVILSPLLAITALLVKVDSTGPVLFRQERVGRKGRKFMILKFRSMVAENDIHDSTCTDKYTRIGKFLRRTSIDELPQIFNVLVGQMSFIGPRPWVPEYWDNMNEVERGRGRVRPGITGLAAAKGRNDLSVFQKISYDLEYVRNYSFVQDVKIFFLTIRTVVKGGEAASAGKTRVHNDIDDLKNRRHILA